MKIKKVISIILVSVILMCSAAMAVSAIEVQEKCPKCGGALMWIILRESSNGITVNMLIEDCVSCDYANVTEIPCDHIDENADNKCDKCGKKIEEEKTPEEPETPVTPNVPDEPQTPDNNDGTSENIVSCTCNCHKSGIIGLFYKLVIFIQKLFGQNKVCACGVGH